MKSKKIIRYFCILLMIVTLVFIIISYGKLSNEVPTHFTLDGKVDGTSDKSFVWFFYVLMVGIYLLLEFVESRPNLWNTPVPLTKENKNRVLSATTTLLEITKVLLVLMFSISIAQIIIPGFPGWIIFVIIGLMIINIIVNLLRCLL